MALGLWALGRHERGELVDGDWVAATLDEVGRLRRRQTWGITSEPLGLEPKPGERAAARRYGERLPAPHPGLAAAVASGDEGVLSACGRRLHARYRGRHATPSYCCPGQEVVKGRGLNCLSIGGLQVDQAVSEALLAVMQPAGLSRLRAAERIEADHDGAREQWRLAVERARYEAERAERRYRAVEPENRLVARGLETEWEQRLSELAEARSLRRRKSSPQHDVLHRATARYIWRAI